MQKNLGKLLTFVATYVIIMTVEEKATNNGAERERRKNETDYDK